MSRFTLSVLPGLMALALLFSTTAAGGLPTDGTVSSHVLVGLTPSSSFELTCNDSLLSAEPVDSDVLGIIGFAIDSRDLPETGTICLRPPCPPTILGRWACSVWDTGATLCWDTDRPATALVEYGTESGAYTWTLPWTTELLVSHVADLEGLTPETTYYYRVSALDAFGNATTSDEGSFATCPPSPAISGVSIAGRTSTSFTVEWTTTSPTYATIEYGVADEFDWTAEGEPEPETEHTLTVSDLMPATVYGFRLVCLDECGQEAVSGDMCVTTLTADLEMVGVSVVDVTSCSAMVRWWTTCPATSRIIYGTTPEYDFSIETEGELSTSHIAVLEGLSPETTYHFRALSTDAGGNEVSTDDLTFTTDAPDAPQQLSIHNVAVTVSDGPRATVVWLTNLPSTSLVEYGESLQYGQSVADGALASIHTVELTGLEAQALYHFRVSSSAGPDLNASTADLTFSTRDVVDLSPPLSPEGLAAAPTRSAIELMWEPIADGSLAGYTVYRRKEGTLLYMPLAAVPAEETTYRDGDVEAGVFYDYAVTARDDAGNESALSTSVRAMAGTGPAGRMWVFPNPVVDATVIRFVLPGQADGRAEGDYSVRIYDAAGRLVRRLDGGGTGAGPRSLSWNATDDAGRRVAGGTYFCVASCPSGSVRSKILVLR